MFEAYAAYVPQNFIWYLVASQGCFERGLVHKGATKIY